MPKNRGKEWEGIFKEICEHSGIDCVRFYDATDRHKDVNNPADFTVSISKSKPSILVECKSDHGASFDLNFRQYDDLLKLSNTNSKVLIWFVEKKEVWALSILYIKKLRDSGVKRFNPKKLPEEKGCRKIPATFARIKPKELDLLVLWEDLDE